VELHLAGHGSDSEYGRKCKQLVSMLGIEKKVKFMGSLTVDQIQGELSSASCMVLCSRQETAPVIIGEAMAIGVPVVASNICGIPYMVEDGQTGKLVNPDDPSDIAAGISYILGYKNPEEMSRRAIAIAKERFRAPVVARKTYDFYKEVIGNI
jgi:glycosyltransferase involved in cell wall biosynthesis